MADFTFDPRVLMYRDTRTGRLIAQPSIDELLNDVLARASRDVWKLTDQLRAGDLEIQDWQAAMADYVADVTLAARALAKGGWGNLTPDDEAAVAKALEFQYDRLQHFAMQLANGEKALDGEMLRRSTAYIASAKPHYENARMEAHADLGYDEVMNEQTTTESCPGCQEASDMEWVPIADMPPIGSRDCQVRCRCVLHFRKSSEAA